MINKTALEEKLKEIYDVIKNNELSEQHHGVLAGVSGISLFQFYYSKYIDQEEPADSGVEMISKTIEDINSGYAYPTFCTGIAGAGWVLEILGQEEFIDIDNDELLSDLDEYLSSVMNNDIENENYDFLHGAIGYGYYFLKRYENTKSVDLKNRYKEYLNHLIVSLKKSSRIEGDGLWWKSVLNKETGLSGANLSLSHGISSIINFYSRLHQYEDFKNLVHDQIVGAVTYMLSHKNEDLSASSWFPSWIHTDMEENSTSRLAWCYGDLGIGISLWKAGNALDNAMYKEEALQILKHSTKRRDIKEAGVMDSGYCHGSCGIAGIYNHMYTETNEEVFKESADYWMNELLKMGMHKNGDAGFMQWSGKGEEWRNETNVLEGIAGIGLTIISFLATFDTKWDECLMIS